MDHIDHFSHGLLTPGLGFLVMCMAAVIGLRCTVRALSAVGGTKRMWLLVGATAIGAGIWTLHFIAMLGFGVPGSTIRYDVPLTLLSLVLAIGVVSAGVFMVGYGRSRARSLLLGGLGTGLGVATMHYSGMAAVRLNGTIEYSAMLVLLSVVIAITAASAALWIVLNVRGLQGTFIAALIMGLAVSSMHYTGMAAVTVEAVDETSSISGATAMEFLFPLSVGIGALLFAAFTIVAVSPLDEERQDADATRRYEALQARSAEFAERFEQQMSAAERQRPGTRRRTTKPVNRTPAP